MELDPVRERSDDVVQGVGPTRVPGNLNLLDRGEVPEGVLLEPRQPGAQVSELGRHVDSLLLGEIE